MHALTSEMRAAVGREALVTIDQEGGRVQRMRSPHWHEWPAPLDLAGMAGAEAARAFWIMYRLIAHELHALGIDSNCAPTLDIAREGTHSFLRNRCFGEDVETVATLGRAVVDAHLAGGVLPVVKHMPGHGRSAVDTHFHLPVVREPITILAESDFATFEALNDAPMGMTAHLVFSEVDDLPATQSAKMIEVIRQGIGFDNLLMTDDLSMEALSGTPAERAMAAIGAGVDVALFCNAPLADRRAVTEAVGQMTPQAQMRAERALAMRRTPDDVDISTLEREFEALTGWDIHG